MLRRLVALCYLVIQIAQSNDRHRLHIKKSLGLATLLMGKRLHLPDGLLRMGYAVYDRVVLPWRFKSEAYLEANPEASAEIASGKYRSARDHYRRIGRSQNLDYSGHDKECRQVPNDVPVALMLFNRPSLTAAVFKQIRQFKPSTLLLIADGPRNELEAGLCADARAVTNQIDWPCKVLRNFSSTNLGCRARVSSGLKWVFDQVDEAIILEDDCLPDPSFFTFCSHLLFAYRKDERIMHISGSCFLPRPFTRDSYWFSRHSDIWGWATWRRAFRHYDENMTTWPRCGALSRHLLWKNPLEREYWKQMFDRTHAGNTDTWDFQWHWAVYRRQGRTIIPRTNLITNLGHNQFGTHTRSSECPVSNLATRPVLDIKHPRRFRTNPRADFDCFNARHYFENLTHSDLVIPAFTRPIDVVVSNELALGSDSIGSQVQRMLRGASLCINIYSKRNPKPRMADFPSLLIESFEGRPSRALTISALTKALGDSLIGSVMSIPHSNQDCLTAICLSETYRAPLSLWVMDCQNIRTPGISDSLMRELIEKSETRLAICEEMKIAYEEKFGLPFAVRMPVEQESDLDGQSLRAPPWISPAERLVHTAR